jgi:arginyl-tRNA synthetase
MSKSGIEERITAELVELCRRYGIANPSVTLEIPKNKEHGDLSTNVAMTSAAESGIPPQQLAEKLAADFPTSSERVEQVEVAGPGFLNFRLSLLYYHNLLKDIATDPEGFGSAAVTGGDRWLFEYVSANPTGPLNIVSARAASVGDTLVRIFKRRGIEARSEYYVNDGGGQVRKLGESVRARMDQIQNHAVDADIPEGGYHGLYLMDVAERLLTGNDAGETQKLDPDDFETLGKFAAGLIRNSQETSLNGFNVAFDRWFYESELYDAGRVAATIDTFTDKGLAYKKDGATYFKASDYGDSEDRVLKTSQHNFTYVVPDIAYHLDKRERGFDHAVVLLGPDHHGHTLNLKAALKALDLPDNFYMPILVQQVNLKRGGEEVKMSKRAGVGITMDELIEEVGVDAARFFFLMRKITSHLDFDLDLAKRHSEDNPVY